MRKIKHETKLIADKQYVNNKLYFAFFSAKQSETIK